MFGVYAAIRFVPDVVTGEGINVGVVLLCEGRVLVHTSSSLRRVSVLSPKEDLRRAKLELQMFAHRLQVARPADAEALRRFAGLEAGRVTISEARPVSFLSADDEFKRLVQVVVPAAHTEPPKPTRLRQGATTRKLAAIRRAL